MKSNFVPCLNQWIYVDRVNACHVGVAGDIAGVKRVKSQQEMANLYAEESK